MKRIIILTASLLLGASAVSAQEFLTVNPDVRTAGMADASVAASGEAYSIFNNAAAALFDYNRFQIGFSYTPWMHDVKSGTSMYSLGGFYSFNGKHSLAFGTRIFSEARIETASGESLGSYPFIPKDENNQPIGDFESFRPLSVSADLAYAYMINKYVGVSVTARYIHSSFGDLFTNSAVDFDLAAYAQIPLNSMLDGAWVSAGLKLSDMGFTFGDGNYDLPMRASVGAAIFAPIRDSHTLQGTVDLGYRFAPSTTKTFGLGIGAEYTLMQLLSLRAGYHVADSKGYNYGTVGAGIRFMHLQVDFSYLLAGDACPWRNTWRVGVGLNF